MQLADHIRLVGSGGLGFSLTDEHDCHVYLVSDADSAVLIDAGSGLAPDRVLERIDRTGIDRSAVDRILVTHAHVDHAGGAEALGRALGARVLAAPAVADILRARDGEAAGFDRMRGPGGYPEDFAYPGCAEVEDLPPGERLGVGGLELEVLSTPGHSVGHLGFLLHRAGGTDLFSGDAAFALGRILLQDLPDCSLQDSIATIRALTELRADGLYPGHGLIAVERGWTHLHSAMSDIEAGLPPRQLTF